MRIPIERESPVPVYRQIQHFIEAEIRSGALPAETRLPASRELASGLGVNRLTVTNAYAELEAAGLVYSRQGSGTYVAPSPAALPKNGGDGGAPADWPLWQQELLSRTWLPSGRGLDQYTVSSHPDPISFADGTGDSHLFPVDDLRHALDEMLRRDGLDALGYGDRSGYAPLRATLAQILTAEGIPARPEHVLITSGAQQALALVAHLLLRPGDVVVVESPTYSGAIDLFRSLDVRLLGVPVDDQGMQVERVEEVLLAARPRLIYTIPDFQNPTGACLSGPRRRQLLALAGRYDVPIVEDDFAGDLRYDGREAPALKALDSGGQVIYLRTFSKMLMPGLRVGFLTATGPVYDRLLGCKRVTDLASSTLIQRALDAYITVGRYQAQLRRTIQVYRRRRDALLAAVARHLPADARCIPPQGGLFAWLRLPHGLSANDLYPVAAVEGVTYVPGSVFYPGEREQGCLRLNFVTHPPEVIEQGMRRLGRAIERCTQQERHPQQPTRSRASVRV